jgi:hypothetical protein
MRRKQSPPPFDWRDPSMPVIRTYRFANGSLRTDIDPDYERRYREHMLSTSAQPHYTDDPTYNLAKGKRRS